MAVVREQPGADRLRQRLRLNRPLVHGIQPLQWMMDLGVQRDDHRAHLVSARAALRFCTHRDRRHGEQRLAGKLALVLQVLAQRPAADRQHHVVHGRTLHRFLHRANRLEVEGAPIEHAMCRHRGVEAGAWHGRGSLELPCLELLPQPRHRRNRLSHDAPEPKWIDDVENRQADRQDEDQEQVPVPKEG